MISNFSGRTYVGCSQDVAKRLAMHNAGRVKSTRKYLPWKVVYQEEVGTYQEARKRERYYKSFAGRKRIKEIVENWRGVRVVEGARLEIVCRAKSPTVGSNPTLSV